MKAFKTVLLLFLLGIFSVSTFPAFAQQSNGDYNIKTFTANPTTDTPPTANPTLTPSTAPRGTVQLLPPGNGDYQITDPNPKNSPYQVIQAACPLNPIDCFVDAFHAIKAELEEFVVKMIAYGVNIVLNTFNTMIIGCDPLIPECQTQLLNAQRALALKTDGEVVQTPPGALFQMATVADSLTPLPIPISVGSALAHMNPFSSANASGFTDLQQADQVFQVWRGARNAAYAFSIIILVIVGFLIMFRTKIDPRTAVTISNSLPKIVIMLLLITFSYAISGLLIDGVRVLSGLLFSIVNIGLGDTFRAFAATLMSFTVLATVATGIGAAIGTIIPGPGTVVGGAVGAVAAVLFILILVVYILIVEIIIIYHMVVRYAQFILGVIFAPLIFLAVPLPNGLQYSIMWIKKELAYLLTIPITIVIVQIAFKVSSSCFPSPFENGMAALLTTGPCNFGFNPFGLLSIVGPFIGLGIFSVALKAPNIADELMGNKPLTGRGGGGGGHFGLGALLGLGALKDAGDLLRLRGNVQSAFGNTFTRRAVNRGLGYERFTNPAAAAPSILGADLNQAHARRTIMNAFPVGTATPVKARLGPGALQHLEQTFEDAGIPRADFASRELPDLVNQLRTEAGLGVKDARGHVVGPAGGGITRAAGRVFGEKGQEGIDKQVAQVERNAFDESINNLATTSGQTPAQRAGINRRFNPQVHKWAKGDYDY